jgi:MATE family multidrug resistance protein
MINGKAQEPPHAVPDIVGTTRSAALRGPAERVFLKGVRAMLRLAFPLALAELGWMAMGVVDVIMVGRLPASADAIGAASLGAALFYPFAIAAIGLLSGMDALVSHAFGADDPEEARRSLGSGLAIAFVASPVAVAIIFAMIPLLSRLGVVPVVRDDAVGFIHILSWSLPLLVIYTCFRRYLQGIHCVRPIAVALISSNLVNAFGNWILIFGHWGAPAMGVRGSALSTVFARVYLAGFLMFVVWLRDPLAIRGLHASRALAGRLLRLGLPAAATIGLEVGVFHTATVLAGMLNPVSLAAHTIVLNAAAVTYMPQLGLGSAAAVSVGRALGAGDRAGAVRAGWTALALATALELFAAGLFLLLPRQITHIYTSDSRVVRLSVTLFAIAAGFQIFDGVQTVATGALRGWGNTKTAMTFNLVAYWFIGLPFGWWLCFRKGWGVAGIWDGLWLALALIAVGLTFVLHRRSRQSR